VNARDDGATRHLLGRESVLDRRSRPPARSPYTVRSIRDLRQYRQPGALGHAGPTQHAHRRTNGILFGCRVPSLASPSGQSFLTASVRASAADFENRSASPRNFGPKTLRRVLQSGSMAGQMVTIPPQGGRNYRQPSHCRQQASNRRSIDRSSRIWPQPIQIATQNWHRVRWYDTFSVAAIRGSLVFNALVNTFWANG